MVLAYDDSSANDDDASLTETERAVLDAVWEYGDPGLVAKHLSLPIQTIREHLQSIKVKLKLRSSNPRIDPEERDA